MGDLEPLQVLSTISCTTQAVSSKDFPHIGIRDNGCKYANERRIPPQTPVLLQTTLRQHTISSLLQTNYPRPSGTRHNLPV